jgi:hypothetical protein
MSVIFSPNFLRIGGLTGGIQVEFRIRYSDSDSLSFF